MGELSTAQLLTAHPQFHHTTPTSVGKIQQQVNSLASVRLIMRQRMDLKGFPSVRFYFEATGFLAGGINLCDSISRDQSIIIRTSFNHSGVPPDQ